jgi:hypothetical protein
MKSDVLERGDLPFSIESRILRELGERLVRQPEVALLELIKNAYDADATRCTIEVEGDTIIVEDTGLGMTRDTFANAWMRIGTSSKERNERSPSFGREITGEKGIGRFAVRFLGLVLQLDSVAYDPKRKHKTRLVADFDWEKFDESEDLGNIEVPYVLTRVSDETPTGTTLRVSSLRDGAKSLDWKKIGTGSVGVVSAVRSLLSGDDDETVTGSKLDPGFVLLSKQDDENTDLSNALLAKYVLRATVAMTGKRLAIKVFRGNEKKPYLAVNDAYENLIGTLNAD